MKSVSGSIPGHFWFLWSSTVSCSYSLKRLILHSMLPILRDTSARGWNRRSMPPWNLPETMESSTALPAQITPEFCSTANRIPWNTAIRSNTPTIRVLFWMSAASAGSVFPLMPVPRRCLIPREPIYWTAAMIPPSLNRPDTVCSSMTTL